MRLNYKNDIAKCSYCVCNNESDTECTDARTPTEEELNSMIDSSGVASSYGETDPDMPPLVYHFTVEKRKVRDAVTAQGERDLQTRQGTKINPRGRYCPTKNYVAAEARWPGQWRRIRRALTLLGAPLSQLQDATYSRRRAEVSGNMNLPPKQAPTHQQGK